MALALALDASGVDQAAQAAQEPGYKLPPVCPAWRVFVGDDPVDKGPNGRRLVAVALDASNQFTVEAVHNDCGPDRLRRGFGHFGCEDNQAHALITPTTDQNLIESCIHLLCLLHFGPDESSPV